MRNEHPPFTVVWQRFQHPMLLYISILNLRPWSGHWMRQDGENGISIST